MGSESDGLNRKTIVSNSNESDNVIANPSYSNESAQELIEVKFDFDSFSRERETKFEENRRKDRISFYWFAFL